MEVRFFHSTFGFGRVFGWEADDVVVGFRNGGGAAHHLLHAAIPKGRRQGRLVGKHGVREHARLRGKAAARHARRQLATVLSCLGIGIGFRIV